MNELAMRTLTSPGNLVKPGIPQVPYQLPDLPYHRKKLMTSWGPVKEASSRPLPGDCLHIFGWAEREWTVLISGSRGVLKETTSYLIPDCPRLPGGLASPRLPDVLSAAFSSLSLALTREDEAIPAFLAFAPALCREAADVRRDEILHPGELAAYDALRFERRRGEFLLGRLAAKVALGRFLEEPRWPAIEVVPGVFQQPLVRHSGSLLPGVCITHSGGTAAAVAFPAAHPMALDLERLDPDRFAVLKTQVSLSEVDHERLSLEEALRRVTQVWTAKESLSKILRCGLMCPFDVLAVDSVVWRNGSARGLFKNFAQYRFESSIVGPFAFSIVLPKRTSLGADVREWLAERVEGCVA